MGRQAPHPSQRLGGRTELHLQHLPPHSDLCRPPQQRDRHETGRESSQRPTCAPALPPDLSPSCARLPDPPPGLKPP